MVSLYHIFNLLTIGVCRDRLKFVSIRYGQTNHIIENDEHSLIMNRNVFVFDSLFVIKLNLTNSTMTSNSDLLSNGSHFDEHFLLLHYNEANNLIQTKYSSSIECSSDDYFAMNKNVSVVCLANSSLN